MRCKEFNTEAVAELVEAVEGLFENCAMIHKHWGDGCNSAEARASIAATLAALDKVKGA